MTTFVVGLPRESYYEEFLSQEDWRSLEALVNSREPTPAAIQICITHEALDRGDLRLALIDGVTACELCLNEALRCGEPSSARTMQAFWNLPLAAQLVSVATARNISTSAGDIEAALKALELRNKVVHEGWTPRSSRDVQPAVESLLRTLRALLAPLPFKFASADMANAMFADSETAFDIASRRSGPQTP